MTKTKGQKKHYFFLIIFLSIIIILNACISNVQEDYNHLKDNKIKIALLLPIGSKDNNLSKLGKSLRDAAFLAKEDLANNLLEIRTYDTYGNTRKGILAYNVALEEKNEIIIGPYLSTVTKEISNQIPFNSVNILSLSDDPTIVGRKIFILGDTVVNRANNLIQYAINNKKYRFAIIGPVKDDNNKILSLISNKILMHRGTITFSSYYSNDVSAISDLAQDIKNRIIQTNTDVIIFTGEPDKRMSHLAAELADITVNKKDKGIQIMGLTHWENSASILSEPALQKAWFTMPDQRFRSFYENKFIKKFGYIPHPKSNLAYDAVASLGVIHKNFNNNKNDYFDKFNGLFNRNGFIGIDGIFRFNNDRIAEKELSIIQLISGKPNMLKQAKSQFQ
jgi:hypothetical protein|tara:strand:- start:314 stop:1489 length:1176 start_codon:yes stop_codon:yes gene_type:complete